MKAYLKVIFAGILGLYLTGCASIMTAEQAAPNLSFQEDAGPLVVAVLDNRPYVLDKDKNPSFEGLIRSNLGMPFSYGTATGEAMSLYLGKRIEHGFKSSGVDTVLYPTTVGMTEESLLQELSKGGKKSLVVSLLEWKYDHHTFSKSSYYDVEVTVLDNQGNRLVDKKFTGKDGIPSGHIANAMQQLYKARFEQFLSDAQIEQALRR